MTDFEIERVAFKKQDIGVWAQLSARNTNWPVVYVLDDAEKTAAGKRSRLSDVYVGESRNAAGRMLQHLDSSSKSHLKTVRVVIDSTFNKSACLDLESYLIRLLAGDGTYRVLNRNDGITDSDYYDRERYQTSFREVFEELRSDGVFTRTIPEIENSDLFKLSPFKSLSPDQAIAVEDIVEGLFENLEKSKLSTIVIQGDPGTGKTVIAIYLMKLLVDIAHSEPHNDIDQDSMFSEFFASGYPQILEGLRLGIVVPQQSLRKSIQNVFAKTPGLTRSMVMTPFEVGESAEDFDILIVDEAHRLNQRANQASGPQNTKFKEITEALFGTDDKTKTQLDWLRAKSRHQILLIDEAQSVRPADLPLSVTRALVQDAKAASNHYRLASQMRVRAESDYVGYVRHLVGAASIEAKTAPLIPEKFAGYDFRLFDSVERMHDEIRRKDVEFGLSRLTAGYAWEWKSKKQPAAYDIEIDGCQLRWNSKAVDWIASPNSVDEVGSIHTVQGYDLNYAGVIIGNDLRYNPATDSLFIDRDSYFDKKGKENNPTLDKVYTDADLLQLISNVYAVLLTRGIRGTYVYVCDPALRDYLKKFIPTSGVDAE
ncbi:DUF2075 domain-containing protein [Salinibacterium sp. NG253]|nr:DUF2075 domain-containing protein [Salinibacterium sp. NG253]